MSFKAAYSAFAFALVIAACGDGGGATSTPDASPSGSPEAGVGAIEALGAMQGGAARPEMKQFVQAVGRIGDAIATVTDEESARAAAATIAGINAEIEPITRVIEGWSESEKRAAAMAAAGDLVAAQQKIGMAAAQLSVNNPQLMEIVAEELNRMPALD